MTKRKQYLQLFALSDDATSDEIKKRYRLLAKKYHPDVNKSPYANETFVLLQEAYDYLISNKSNDQSYFENSKSDEISRMERIKRAKERLKEARLQEQNKIKNEYQKITNSRIWLVFKTFAYISLICSIFLVIDLFAPKKMENAKIVAFSTNYNGFYVDKICLIQTEKNNQIFVSSAVKHNLNKDNRITIERSRIFNHPTDIHQFNFNGNEQFNVEFSFYNFSIFIALIFTLPIIIYRKRNPSHGFFFLYRFALYTVFPILFYFLVTESRLIHLITFGFL